MRSMRTVRNAGQKSAGVGEDRNKGAGEKRNRSQETQENRELNMVNGQNQEKDQNQAVAVAQGTMERNEEKETRG